MRYGVGILAAAALMAVTLPVSAQTVSHYKVKTSDAHDCKGGLHVGPAATSRMLIGCLIKASADIDLDAPDAATQAAAVWPKQVGPELMAKWQADPKSALGKIDGYVPQRMEDISLTATDEGTLYTTYSLSGRWISVADSHEKGEAISIKMTMIGGRFWLMDVSRP